MASHHLRPKIFEIGKKLLADWASDSGVEHFLMTPRKKVVLELAYTVGGIPALYARKRLLGVTSANMSFKTV